MAPGYTTGRTGQVRRQSVAAQSRATGNENQSIKSREPGLRRGIDENTSAVLT